MRCPAVRSDRSVARMRARARRGHRRGVQHCAPARRRAQPHGAEPVGEAKAYLRLGAEILRTGGVGSGEARRDRRGNPPFRRDRARARRDVLDVFVTAPARQAANADELVHGRARHRPRRPRALGRGGGRARLGGRVATTPAASTGRRGLRRRRRLDPDDGRGERRGVSGARPSTRIAAADGGRARGDPPTADSLRRRGLRGSSSPTSVRRRSSSALAVGGSARALAARRPAAGRGRARPGARARRFAVGAGARPPATVDATRAATLAGGATILREVTRLLGQPLQLAGGGLREGAVARLLARRTQPRRYAACWSSSATSSRTRQAMSSRISRTRSTGSCFGSGSCQAT